MNHESSNNKSKNRIEKIVTVFYLSFFYLFQCMKHGNLSTKFNWNEDQAN